MADSVELPNVDIFDPVMCARRWAQCATQQEINVYLNKQIDVNRSVLKETIDAQNAINAASKTKLDNHESRITSLETGLSNLNKAQKDLNTAFQQLQTDNNNFKSNVDLLLNQYQTTINLLQQNIDKISTSNEQLWNEVNKLKSQFDPDKLDAAIAGYQGVLADANKYTDSEIAKVNATIDANQSALNTWQLEHDSNFNQYKANISQRFTDERNYVNQELQVIRGGFEAYRAHIDKTVSDYHDYFEAANNRQDKTIAALQQTVSDNKTAGDKALADTKADLQQQLDDQRTEYVSFNTAQTQIIEGNRADSEKRDEELDQKIADNAAQAGAMIQAIRESDQKQWDTINSILEAQNRINTNMENLYKYVNEQIELVKSDIESLKSSVGDLQTESQALALRAEYLEQRTGWKFKVTAKAGANATPKYDVGFGTLRFNVTANQVQVALDLNAGVSGLMSIKDTAYGMLQVISGTLYNVINGAGNPNVITGYIIGYAGSASPVEFICWYDPATALVTFQCGYETNAQVMPKTGGDAQVIS